jgi:prepilin-type N-terminal cleavage/methylation domain-containing protein
MCSKYLRCGERRALTLIEVMTALALLSTLLVGMLLAFTKNAEQIRRDALVCRSVSAADSLLRKWADENGYPPRQGQGSVPGTDEFVWQTRPQKRAPSGLLGLNVVNLEIFLKDAGRSSEPVLVIQVPVPNTTEHPAAEQNQ